MKTIKLNTLPIYIYIYRVAAAILLVLAGCFINPSGSLAKDIFTKPTMTVNPGRGISITDEAALDKMIKNSGGDYKKLVTEPVTAYKGYYNFAGYGCPYKKWVTYNNRGMDYGYCYDSPTVTRVVSGTCKRYGRTVSCPDRFTRGDSSSNYSLISVTGCPAGYTLQRVMTSSADFFYFCQKNL